mmetsp:Transcript_15738/g.13761  ORF Transcript_15738/g.13761 Transcript_15738/m.13761 type:complete len:160 (-) Transcript_15738:185-664(-)
MSKNFVFFLGDIWYYVKNLLAGKVFYDHFRHISAEVCRYDFKMDLQGTNPVIKLISYNAQQGLEALTTGKIDRAREYIGIGKVIGNSFGMSRSTAKAMHRRKLVLNMLSFNAASKYIPTMYNCLSHEVGEWKKGQTFNVLDFSQLYFLEKICLIFQIKK